MTISFRKTRTVRWRYSVRNEVYTDYMVNLRRPQDEVRHVELLKLDSDLNIKDVYVPSNALYLFHSKNHDSDWQKMSDHVRMFLPLLSSINYDRVCFSKGLSLKVSQKQDPNAGQQWRDFSKGIIIKKKNGLNNSDLSLLEPQLEPNCSKTLFIMWEYVSVLLFKTNFVP